MIYTASTPPLSRYNQRIHLYEYVIALVDGELPPQVQEWKELID